MGLVGWDGARRFARGANNPPFAMILQRMGHPTSRPTMGLWPVRFEVTIFLTAREQLKKRQARLGLTGSYGKDAVNNHLNFLEDDDNDTALFERLQQQVLENCPNPERIGCPSPSILRAFVEDPAFVTPAELNDFHILKCAECARDLMELRKNRESRQTLESAPSRRRLRSVVPAAMVIAVLCSILVTAIIYRKGDLLGSRSTASKAVTVARTVDLSSYAATRGVEPAAAGSCNFAAARNHRS
jgi:hypothetical protein